MVTPVKNSLLKRLTYSIIFPTSLYGSPFSFMVVSNVKPINTFPSNLKTFLLLYHFMKMLLILITESQWILKAPSLLLLITIHIFSLSLMPLAILLLLIQRLISHLKMQFKLLHHWITNFGPPQYLVTDRGTEYINQDMAHLCSLFNNNHSPRTPYSPWTNGLVEVQNRNLGTHLSLFLQNSPTNWSFQTQMYAYSHNTITLSQLKLSPYQIVFHTHPRIPLTSSLNVPRDSLNKCIASYCDSLPPHTHYSNQDLNPFLRSFLDKPICSWLLSAELAMLEIYSTVHRHINNKLNSQSSTFETTHLKQLPPNTFVIHTNFKPVKCSQILKPLRLGPYKILKQLPDVTSELMSQDGFTFQTRRNHILPYYPKEPVIFPNLRQYLSTPSYINNPDADSYQDKTSQFSPLTNQSSSDLFHTQTSTKDISYDSSPKHQNLSHSLSLNEFLDNTFDSTDSDFDMLPNPIYYSHSSENSFPQIYPRVADSPNTSLTFSNGFPICLHLHQSSSLPIHLTFTPPSNL